MILDLVPCNHPILRQPAPKFDFADPLTDPIDLAKNLTETMLANNGIGLSANQCGLPYRVFVIAANPVICCFNPIIVDSSGEHLYMEEGCLSFPGLYVRVKRPRRVKMRYTEPNGNIVTQTFDGITARVAQHEYDHLNGVLHTHRANKIHLERARNAMKRNERNAIRNRT